MKEDKPESEKRADIRRQAEKVLKGKTTDLKKLSSGDAQKLVHELEVHQIELEMQNEELRTVQKELEDARYRYSDLYDFAPIGYFTFDRKGLILEVNLTGAKKLGRERGNLIKKPFFLYITPDHKDAFCLHLHEVFNTETQTTCELQLVDKKGNIFDAKLESIPVRDIDGNLLARTAMSDITQRKRAEKLSYEARIFAESIIDTVRKPFVVLDKDLKVLSANLSFYSTFKVTPDETVGNLIYDIGNRQWDIPSLRKLLEEILPKHTQFNNYEVLHRFQTIGQKIMLLNARQIYQEEIGTPSILLAIEDITQRRQMEIELEESESRYRRLFEAAQDGILILDADTGKINDVNPFLINILGYSYEEFIGKELWEFGFFKDIGANKVAFFDLQTKGYVRYEDLPLKKKDGRSIDVEFVSNIYQVNNKKVIQCNIRDISERRQMEIELVSSESRYRRLFEAAQDGILILDVDKEKIIDVNPFLINILRSSYEDFIGKELWEIGLLKDIEANKAAFLELQTKGYVRYEDLPLKTKDGRSINVEFVSNVYLVNMKKVIQCNIRDITERKQMDEELKKYREHLEDLVNERTREMRIAKDEAVRANAFKTDLLMKMSHELRTPLNAILGFSDLLNMRHFGELNETQEHYNSTISNSGKHLLGIINDMLDLAKVESGEKLPLLIESFPVQRAIDETLIFVNEKAIKNSILIKKEIDPEIDIIRADKIRFKQILLKLLDNAMKFSKPQGGTILISARKAGEMAQFSVSDTGIGIIEENIEKIFGMFYQEESGIRRKYSGTGVGLAIIKQLVELHGGKIYVESKNGIGTTFTFLIPLKAYNGEI